KGSSVSIVRNIIAENIKGVPKAPASFTIWGICLSKFTKLRFRQLQNALTCTCNLTRQLMQPKQKHRKCRYKIMQKAMGITTTSAMIPAFRKGTTMVDFSGLIKQLTTERDRLNAAIAALQNINGASPTASVKRRLSTSARAKIAAAQRARWAKVK